VLNTQPRVLRLFLCMCKLKADGRIFYCVCVCVCVCVQTEQEQRQRLRKGQDPAQGEEHQEKKARRRGREVLVQDGPCPSAGCSSAPGSSAGEGQRPGWGTAEPCHEIVFNICP